MRRILSLLPPLLAAALMLAVPAPAGALPPDAGAVTPSQAQQTLEILQDPKKRDQLIQTLQVLAKAAPTAPRPAGTVPGLPLAAHSLGAQLLVQGSRWLDHLSVEVAEAARSLTEVRPLWQWLVRTARDPGIQTTLLDAAWRLVLVLGGALAAEWGLQRTIRRPLAGLDAHAARHGGGAQKGTWRRVQMLPLVVGRLILEWLPVLAFALVGNFLLGLMAGAPETGRAIILSAVNAYVTCRSIMCVTRAVVGPATCRLGLVPMNSETAAYIEIWVRRITVVLVFGLALADIALLLGLDPATHDSLMKFVVLIVHLFLVIIVLQSRSSVAQFLRARAEARGALAVVRNRIGDLWHVIAIFFIVALWVVWAINIENGVMILLHYFFLTVLVLILARLASILALGALDRVFRITPDFVRRFPGLEARANRYYPLLRRAISTVIGIVTLLAVLETWGIHAFRWFTRGTVGERLVSAVMTVGLTVLIAIAVWEMTNASLERHIARLAAEAQHVRSARLKTLAPMLRTALFIAILIVVAMTTLNVIGLNIGPLLAGAGIIGVAVGFGSQKLVQDLITGMFLLFENAMQVGDWVTAAGLSGSVEHLSIRTLRLRAGDGSVHIIPFSAVTSVTNTNRGLGNAAVTVNLRYEEDTDRVAALLKDIVHGMREEPAFKPMMLGDLDLWGVDKVDASGVTMTGQIVCTDAGRWPVQREFNRRMKLRFQEAGIEIANPTQTILLHHRDVGDQRVETEQEPPKTEARSSHH